MSEPSRPTSGQRSGPPAEPAASEHAGEEHPTGTLVLMLLFIVVIIVLWSSIYLMLMGRG